ncbi:hypothetical protein TNCV_550441 [Trichonephila clavipes]|nr:hypothetical protein TNCV_550441 [Trichonephila clavipes]
MLPGCSTSLTALFHGCGSHLKLLECVVTARGGRVTSTTPAKAGDISSYQQKRNRKYPGKGPISDMQYHGVGWHHDQWPHVATCGCEWDYAGQRNIDEVLLPHVRLLWCCR